MKFETAELMLIAKWSSEPEAGIIGGRQQISIRIDGHVPFDGDQVEYWRQAVKEFYDGAVVLTEEEEENEIREEEKWLEQLHEGRVE